MIGRGIGSAFCRGEPLALQAPGARTERARMRGCALAVGDVEGRDAA
jgi:hypothetical protein